MLRVVPMKSAVDSCRENGLVPVVACGGSDSVLELGSTYTKAPDFPRASEGLAEVVRVGVGRKPSRSTALRSIAYYKLRKVLG